MAKRGIRVAQSYGIGQCESLERWERVTESHVFSFWGTAIGEFGGQQTTAVAVHIGRIIEEELKRQKRTKAWLAREVNCERTNIYNVLKSADINTSMLMRISKALNKNLFANYSREFQKRRGKASE